jgi:hypothetical protein
MHLRTQQKDAKRSTSKCQLVVLLDLLDNLDMGTCRRKFRSQTSDNMDRWKAEVGRVREEKGRRKKKKGQRRERVRAQKDQRARKGRKVAKHFVFPLFLFWRSRGPRRRLAKADGAEPPGQMRDKQLHAAVA